MAFIYNENEADDLSKVRGQIGDTEEKSGPRPSNSGGGGTNFSDAVITSTITQEKTWQRAVANIFERLAAEWAKKASINASGSGQSTGIQYNAVAGEFRKQAKLWRDRYGYVEDDATVVEGVSAGVFNLGFQATNS